MRLPLRILSLSVLAASLLLAAGCACQRCDQERDRTRVQWGEPEDREIRKDGSLFTETWFYLDDNRSVVFLWDERDCACDVSTYSFPSRAAAAAAAAGGDPGEPSLSFRTARTHPFAP